MMISPADANTSYYSYAPSIYDTHGAKEEEETTANDIAKLGKDDFLKLLIAEMQHQDPLNPADNTEFVAQLAQFTSLEQMTQMNGNIEDMLTSNEAISESVNNAMMINYFGSEVIAETDVVPYDGETDVTLTFDLNSSPASAAVEIYDANDTLVTTVDVASPTAGENSVVWDGTTDLGVPVGEGTYTYTVKAFDVYGEEVDFTPLYKGKVQGIARRDGEVYLNIDDVLVPLNYITDITAAGTADES